MSGSGRTRVAYFNGKIVPEGQVMVPYRDRSFKMGDGCFDMTRTFDGRIFRLREHVERLYRSLAYLGIDPGLRPEEMLAITEQVVADNEPLRAAAGDWWVGQRISRGVDAIGDEGWEHTGPQVIVDCTPLPLRARARLFRDGIDVVVPSTRRAGPSVLSPRAKTHNYLNLVVADREVKARAPEAWSVLLDEHGNLCEGIGSNVFLVRGGRLLTPQERYVLPGVSRQMAIDLAGRLGIPFEARDLDVYDGLTADEMFLTSTSLCLCPVRSFNGRPVGGGGVPGPVTRRLMDAYAAEVGVDFAAQYLSRLT
jgi:branched-chain amino acid aminotransferase